MKFGSMFSFALSSLALAFATTAFAANAEAAHHTSTVLKHVEAQGKLEERYVAIVALDSKTETVKVSILNDICGTFANDRIGHACLAMPALVDGFELPYKKTVDGCGVINYEARRDQRPADGLLVELNYTDYSKTDCEMFTPGLQVLQIDIDSLRGNPVKYYAFNTESVAVEQSKRDDAAIYNALNVEEVDLNPGIAGSRRTQKSIGGLTCTKSLTIVPLAKPSYSCSLAN
mgnify:CR=1 FL=1